VDAAGERARDEHHLELAAVDADALVAVGVLVEGRAVAARAVRDALDGAVEGRAVHVHVGDVHEHADADAAVLFANHGHLPIGWRDDALVWRRALRVAVEPDHEPGDGQREHAPQRRRGEEREADDCRRERVHPHPGTASEHTCTTTASADSPSVGSGAFIGPRSQGCQR